MAIDFFMFGMVCVMDTSMRTLLSQHGSYVGKKEKKKVGGQLQCASSKCSEWKETEGPLKINKETKQAIKLSS